MPRGGVLPLYDGLWARTILRSKGMPSNKNASLAQTNHFYLVASYLLGLLLR